jgi:hypothetical protein
MFNKIQRINCQHFSHILPGHILHSKPFCMTTFDELSITPNLSGKMQSLKAQKWSECQLDV